MSTYSDARQGVRAAVMAGGFSATQADALTSAVEQFCEQFFEAKFAQVLAVVPQQPPGAATGKEKQ